MTDTGNHEMDDLAPERISTHDRKDEPRDARPLGEGKHDHLADKVKDAENRQEALVDEGVEETFPASDPATPKRIT